MNRVSAMLHAARLDLRMRRARQRECDALACAGEQLATSGHCPPSGECQALLAEIQRLRAGLDAHAAALSGSLDADRRDYLAVARWMRPVVILRGFCGRAVLRHRAAGARRNLVPLYRQLAAAALAEPSGASGGLLVQPALADAVRGARTELARLVAERTRLFEPFGGKAYPGWVGFAVEEVAAFTRALATQLHGQVIPRASGLAGLAAGWWVTHTYTASRPRSVLRSLGIGNGGTHVVSGDTYRSMRFWLPLLAAAICAYLGNRIARWIQQRYHPHREHSGSPQPEPVTHRSLTA
jgi:hypothetical protein